MKVLKGKRRARVGTRSRGQRALKGHPALPSRRAHGRRTRSHLRGGSKLSRPGAKNSPELADISTQNAVERQHSDAQYLAAVKSFESAVRFFHKQNYERASEILAKLVDGRAPEVAERARIYLRMCEQKLARPRATLRTARDYYDLGVAQLNARALDAAIENLGRADKMEPNQDHVRYALAAAHALQGNSEAALEHLKAAIELRVANRSHARYDEDLHSLAGDPRFKRLVGADASPTS